MFDPFEEGLREFVPVWDGAANSGFSQFSSGGHVELCSMQWTCDNVFPESATGEAGARVAASVIDRVELSVNVRDGNFPVIHLNMFQCAQGNFVNIGNFKPTLRVRLMYCQFLSSS